MVLCVVRLSVSGYFERKDHQEGSMLLALAQKPEGFSGWRGNVAREAPGGRALNLVIEFPNLITHLPQSTQRSRELGSRAQGCLPQPYSWIRLMAGGAGAQCVYALPILFGHLCWSAQIWLRLTDPTVMQAQGRPPGKRVLGEVKKAVLII